MIVQRHAPSFGTLHLSMKIRTTLAVPPSPAKKARRLTQGPSSSLSGRVATFPLKLRVCGRERCSQASARRFLRNSSGASMGSTFSICSCVLRQTGTARSSRACPFAVRLNTRLRRLDGSGAIFTRPRRSRGLSAAVSVVRSMAKREATGPIAGGSGRLSETSRENWPLVSSNGRNASSKRRARTRAARCTCKQRQQSRTSRVVSYGSCFPLDTRAG